LKILGDIRKSRSTTGVNDNSGKFATGVNDISGKIAPVSMTLAANLPTLSKTPAVTVNFACVVDTGGK
jgi:hypothetical protein